MQLIVMTKSFATFFVVQEFLFNLLTTTNMK